ncbi:hypothetical protein ACFQ3Z_04240 [Streptomyces nogalater]
MTSTSPLMPPHLRKRIAADPSAGLGDALRTALEHSPAPDVPFLTTERPVTDVDGTERSVFSLRGIDALVDTWSCHYADRGVAPATGSPSGSTTPSKTSCTTSRWPASAPSRCWSTAAWTHRSPPV